MPDSPTSTGAAQVPLSEQCRDLPVPVRGYLLNALGSEARPLEALEMQQTGMLRSDPSSERWLRFRANQRTWPQLRQFDWDARIRLAPLVHLRVRDAYAGGIGQGQVHLWSWLKLAADRDSPELNAGALHRFLAEAPWYPTALLPSAGVRWSAIDESSALAMLEDAGTRVSLEFRFTAAGEVASIYTPGRWRRVGRSYQRCAWQGNFSDYRAVHGLRVPFHAEVGWHIDGRLELVWRGEITRIEHHFNRVDS